MVEVMTKRQALKTLRLNLSSNVKLCRNWQEAKQIQGHTICTSTAGAHHHHGRRRRRRHHHHHHSGISVEHIEHICGICGQVLLSRGTSTRAQVTGVRLKTFIKEGKKAVQLQKLCNFRKPLHTPR